MERATKKILLTGGGTGGSVTPLLAIAEGLRARSEAGEYNFLWVGTEGGLEREMAEQEGIAFKSIPAGKWRRYFSLKNFSGIFLTAAGFVRSLRLIRKWHPELILSAGSFVSVPVVWAGWLLRVPVVIHQLDARPGLANRLMAPCARAITVTFEKSLKDYGRKAVWTGNPIRPRLYEKYLEHRAKIKDDGSLPVVLVMGGGTGAAFINRLVEESIGEISNWCEVIHITGKNRSGEKIEADNYQSYEFLNLDELSWAYAAADFVITRAGIGALTELSALGKPCIIIPMPGSHQEDNAQVFHEQRAALVLKQDELDATIFTKILQQFIADRPLIKEYAGNIKKVMKTDALGQVYAIVNNLLKN